MLSLIIVLTTVWFIAVISIYSLEDKLRTAKKALKKIKNIKAKDVVNNPEAVVYHCQSIATKALTTLSND